MCLQRGAGIGYSMSLKDVMDLEVDWFEFFWEEKNKTIEQYNLVNKG